MMDERGLTRPFDGETVEDVVREYEDEGFVVVRDPDQSQLPAFLAPFKPRLVAYGTDGDSQKVVVEVMSRAELRKARYLPDLTGVVDAHEREGWRVDLYVIPPIPAVDGDVQELDRDGINTRVDTVQDLLRGGQHDAALLIAWSVAEAALRQFARRESVPLKNERPLAVIATLYSVGLLSRADYDFLREAKRARDVIVHGFRSPDLAPDFVLHLLEKVERRFQPVAA